MSDVTVMPTRVASEPADQETTATVAVIVAIAERPHRLESLYAEARAAFRGRPWSVEFVFVAEPWARELLEPLRRLRGEGEPIRLLIAGQVVGETALIRAAASAVDADVVLTLPAYHRVEAAALPGLVERVLAGDDMVVARRWPRRDGAANRVQTRAFHGLLRALTGTTLTDVACGVRAMTPQLLATVPMYGDFGRFLPVLASRHGYRVVEVPAAQHELDRPTRVYSPGVYLRRMLDILGLFFLTRFTEKPLRFFGLLGATGFGAGFLVLAILLVQKTMGEPMADRPLLLLGVLLVVLGVQAIALGLVGEIIVHLHAGRRRPYRLWAIHDADDGSPRV